MIGKKVLTKIVLLLIVLFGVTILTFVYTNLSPVDAAEALAVRRYSRPTAEQIELVREELGKRQKISCDMPSPSIGSMAGNYMTMPVSVETGGATIFVTDVERFEKF